MIKALHICFIGVLYTLTTSRQLAQPAVACVCLLPHHNTQPFCSNRSSFCSTVTPPSCLHDSKDKTHTIGLGRQTDTRGPAVQLAAVFVAGVVCTMQLLCQRTT